MEEMQFYTLEEIAKALKVSKRTLYRFIQSGELQAVKIGQNWRVSEQDFNDFLQKQPHT